MADIEKRVNGKGKVTYRARVRLKGYPTQTASFDRLTTAKMWTQDTESDIRNKRHFKTAEAKKHTFGEMADRYIENIIPTKATGQQKQEAQLNWWKSVIGDYTLADITPALISEQRDILLNEHTNRGSKRSPSTVNRYLAILSHAFTVAVNEWGWLEDSPMRKVRKPKESRGRVRFLDDDERTKLLDACMKSECKLLYPIIVLAISTGMRFSEIINLTWKDVNLKERYIILNKTKNNERRRVPLVGFALESIEGLRSVPRIDTPLLFAGASPDKPITIRKPWIKALNEAGIEDFRFHDLRHCTASYLAMNGASLAEIAEVLGHKTLSMVKRYAHLGQL